MGQKSKKPWKKKNVTIYLEQDDIDSLDEVALDKRMSRNELILYLIEKGFELEEKNKSD